jgi:serine/threonine protein kinase
MTDLPFDPLRDVTFSEAIPEAHGSLSPDERPTKAYGKPAPGLEEELEAARGTFLDLDADANEWTSAGVALPKKGDHELTLKGQLTRVGTRYGPFEVTGTLGEGAMSVVLRGVHTRTGTPVAIKVLWVDMTPFKKLSDNQATLAEATIRERFRREAIAVSQLRHPNVISVFSFGIHKNHPFMVLELLEGGSVKDLIQREGAIPPHQAVDLGLGILAGLEAAHVQGFLHRDVKPDNLMLDATGRVKVVDFGLVRLVGGENPLTRVGSSLGTPLYMAPEQGEGSDVDARADVYAVGATLYQLLTGTPPFRAKNVIELAAMKAGPPPSLRERRPEIPEAIDHVVQRMLAPRPDDRYATAGEARQALAEALPRIAQFEVTLGTPTGTQKLVMPEGSIVLLGRSAKRVDVAIDDPSLSRCHCLLQATAHGLSVVDLNSSNGTFVGGRRIRHTQPLRNGEEVRVGDTALQLSWTARPA